ncbi:MAG: hypothetical protein HKO56_05010 [Bacteroidia bacterium]|nr:hypothetical protein [Bacteroidia bacterium]NNC84693.1 hypothetical protein [Bacteroidia bacterium]NNM15998.1 hypothetical protein [Bacteroidia bacterium]
MKVFGIGLNKTGTTTLGKALEILGFNNHVTFDLELTKNYYQNNFEPIISAASANNNMEDWPWPLVYEKMFSEFKNAKFILTTRSTAAVWYKSLCKHAERTGPTEFRKLIYGFEMPQGHKEEHVQFYNQHNQNVETFFTKKDPEKLLSVCWEDGSGWEEICHFLGCEIPREQFPNLNKAADFNK